MYMTVLETLIWEELVDLKCNLTSRTLNYAKELMEAYMSERDSTIRDEMKHDFYLYLAEHADEWYEKFQ